MTASRRLTPWTAAALALVGLVLAAVGAVLARPWQEDPPASGPTTGDGVAGPTCAPSTPDPSVPESGRGRPVRIEIPAIDVSAEVRPITPVAGVLTPPDDVRLVGWWEGGAQPGDERGTVLMAGHTYSRGDGVFDHLGELASGERVRVVTAQGVVSYRVRSVAEYPREEIAELAPQLFATSGQAQLVLTTCSGYDGAHYQRTTVVRAAPEQSEQPTKPE